MPNTTETKSVPEEMLAVFAEVDTNPDANPSSLRLRNMLAGLANGDTLPPDMQARLDANAMTCWGGRI